MKDRIEYIQEEYNDQLAELICRYVNHNDCCQVFVNSRYLIA